MKNIFSFLLPLSPKNVAHTGSIIIFTVTFGFSYIAHAAVNGIPYNPDFPKAQYPYAQAPDGCSGWQSTKEVRDTWGPVDFRGPCNTHDKCYYTLGSDWKSCNQKFYSDLRAACERDLRTSIQVSAPTLSNPLRTRRVDGPPDPTKLRTCYTLASGYYAGVQAGVVLKVFKEAQAKQRRYEEWIAQIRNSPNNQNYFAAIARAEKTGRLGWAWGHRSQSEAEKGAIQACKDSDCKTVIWVQNGYAAIAYGDDLSWGNSWGKSQEEASQKAIQSCKQFAQNPQSCTVVKVLESTKGILVNNPIPTQKTATVPTQQPTQTIAALDPQWNYSVFTYEDKRYGGQARYELKKTNNGVIAIHTNGKGDSYTFSLVEGKPDYIVVSSVISPTDNYYIKLYKNGNAEWTAGKTMHENGWTAWGPGQWLDAGSSENNACVTVDSKKGWQRFNLGGSFSRVASLSGGWSVDTRNYPTVGASGHTGSDAEKLAPYNQYKYDQNFPFGALIVDIPTDGHGYTWVREPQQLPKSIGQTTIRINDADNALGDNGGNLQVCFGK